MSQSAQARASPGWVVLGMRTYSLEGGRAAQNGNHRNLQHSYLLADPLEVGAKGFTGDFDKRVFQMKHSRGC